jgi:hypothetical protein
MPWYWTSVYYSPDRQTTRLRKGLYIETGEWIPSIGGWDPRFGERYFVFEIRPVRSKSYQVSLPGEPFNEELGTPHDLLLPLPAPKGFSDDEIVEIVDFVYSLKGNASIGPDGSRIYSYSQSREEKVSKDGSISTVIAGPMPIIFDPGDSIGGISRDGKVVTVRIGACQGMLSAFYTVIRCVKTVGGYKLIDSYNEVS